MKQFSKNARLITLLFAITTIISSCKRDNFVSQQVTDEQKIERAKAWYIKEHKNDKLSLKSNKSEKLFKLVFDPIWEKAAIETFDGNEMITIPVGTSLKIISGLQTDYKLLILIKDGNYVEKIVEINDYKDDINYLSPNELYKTAFKTDNLLEGRIIQAEIKVFSQNFKEDKHILYSQNRMKTIDINNVLSSKGAEKEGSNNGSSTKVAVTICTNWFLQIEIYDHNDWLVDVQMIPLRTTCETTDIETIDYIANDINGSYASPDIILDALMAYDLAFALWITSGNQAERALAWNNPYKAFAVYVNAKNAEVLALAAFPSSTIKQDAVRHSLWNALNARSIGQDYAKRFGDAHEDFPANDPVSMDMDLRNNAIGRELAKQQLTDVQLYLTLCGYIASGKLWIIKNGHVVPSNQ